MRRDGTVRNANGLAGTVKANEPLGPAERESDRLAGTSIGVDSRSKPASRLLGEQTRARDRRSAEPIAERQV
jgi:hypothetical protein